MADVLGDAVIGADQSALIAPRLTANDVSIRRYCADDMQPLIEAVRESVSTAGRWLDWCKQDYDETHANAWLQHCTHAWVATDAFEFAIISASSGRYLGGIGIDRRDRIHNAANLGYWVRATAQNRAVATIAAALALRFAFIHLRLARIEIAAALGNAPSRRVAEKSGASQTSIVADRVIVRGEFVPAAVYALSCPPSALAQSVSMSA